jgi:organic hydroperoxide reductase OsmC/OhrA
VRHSFCMFGRCFRKSTKARTVRDCAPPLGNTMLTGEGGIVHSGSRRTSRLPDLQETQFKKLAGEAEKNCPVSKLLNAAITLDAKLI